MQKEPSAKRDLPTVHVMDKGIHIQKGKYSIQQIPDLVVEPTRAPWFTPSIDSTFLVATNAVTWILWSVYIWCELHVVNDAQNAARQTLWQLWMMLAGEAGVLIPDSFVSFEVILPWLFGKTKERTQRYRLLGDEAPSIDIAIACCGEDPNVIMDTVKAAGAQDYPIDQYRIFVLDDRKDATLERLISDFQAKDEDGPLITYIARPKPQGVRHYFKGGNVHNGYEVSRNLGKGSEFFAALDADMITEPDWLRRVVPHLILDKKLALACPPQVTNSSQ